MDETFSLPGGLVIDDKLETEIALREMTGFEEDILSDIRTIQKSKGSREKRLKVSPTERITQILARCTVRIGDHLFEENRDPRPSAANRSTIHKLTQVWHQALAGDRGFAVVQLRRLTQGDTYVFPFDCPACGKHHERTTVDLANLEVQEFFSEDTREEAKQLLAQEYVLAITPSGKHVKWKPLGTRGEELLNSLEDDDNASMIASIALQTHIISVEEDTSVEAVQILSSRDRAFLRSLFESAEGGIDTSVDIVCEKCGVETKTKMNVGDTSFFFPSEK